MAGTPSRFIGPGIGFSLGTIKFIVTRGLGVGVSAAANFYKQMHHRLGRYHVTAEADVPQKYQKLG